MELLHVPRQDEIPKGLFLNTDVITEDEEANIMKWLDAQVWSTAIKRRTQHYGYEYSYTSKFVSQTIPMSGPILDIANRLSNIFNANQCIVNEYYRDQAISPHIDANMFGPIIMGLSIGAPANMIFTNGDKKFIAYLPRRSLVLLQDEARTLWKHSIPSTKKIITPDGIIDKQTNYRRISLTYRTVNSDNII